MTDWVRLWHDMPTDPKWRVIARKSGQPLACVVALYTLLMTTASAAEARGDISALPVEDAAAALDMDEDAVQAILDAMQERVIADGRLSGWERRQPKRERENDDSSQRVAKFRKAQKEAGVTASVEPDATIESHVTPCNATKRLDKRREDKNITPLPPLEGDASQIPDWLPVDEWRDFKAMRAKIRKPMTAKAEKLAIDELNKLRRDGNPPAAVLDQSILNCWQGLFPIRTQQGQSSQSSGLDAMARKYGTAREVAA